MDTEFCSKNIKARDHLVDLGVDGISWTLNK
jgi:hypothetical protein